MSIKRLLVLSLFLIYLFYAQAASIKGKIFDEKFKPIKNAIITIQNHNIETNSSGVFDISGLRAGKTTLNISYNGYSQNKAIILSEKENILSLRFSPEKTSPPLKTPEINLYGLSGYIEVFSSRLSDKNKQLAIFYSRTKKEGDYSYDTFHYHLYYKLSDNLESSLSLIDSSRVSKWFRNRREFKSINLKYSAFSLPLGIGGSFSDSSSFYFIAYDFSISDLENMSVNFRTISGNLRKAALNIAYTKKIYKGSGIIEAIMKEDKYKIFNLGYDFDYQGLNYNLFYHRDNLDHIQSAGIGIRLNWD